MDIDWIGWEWDGVMQDRGSGSLCANFFLSCFTPHASYVFFFFFFLFFFPLLFFLATLGFGYMTISPDR